MRERFQIHGRPTRTGRVCVSCDALVQDPTVSAARCWLRVLGLSFVDGLLLLRVEPALLDGSAHAANVLLHVFAVELSGFGVSGTGVTLA